MTRVLLVADNPQPVAAGWQLVLAALAGIALIVVLITLANMNPFLALIFGSLMVGSVAGENPEKVLTSFADGFGSTAASVGTLIALGAMFAKLLADSGGADEIVDTIVGRASPRALPWAMALVGAIIGLPMFFEIGLVLLMPVIYLVARRSQLSIITVGIPALAGLSAMHGLVPPHPGPLVAIANLHADLGITLAFGVVVAIPTVIVAGPLFGKLAGRWVVVEAPATFAPAGSVATDDTPRRATDDIPQRTTDDTPERTTNDAPRRTTERGWRRPSFGITLFSVLLPVALMLGKAVADILIKAENQPVRIVFDVLGTPLVALLIAVVVGMFTFGVGVGMSRQEVAKCVESGLPPV
ncbi:MAG: gluconate transporter, partial [Mycobacteriaceae bacterium]|nr:gluconate transporter [Mycobacteriaceae bacterium]